MCSTRHCWWCLNLCCHFYLQTVLRIWDCLFYEGSKILFRVALTLIHHNQALIEQARSLPDVCQSFKQITHGPFVDECHTFMQVCNRRRNVSPCCSLRVISQERSVSLKTNTSVMIFIPFVQLFWCFVFFLFLRTSSLNQEASPQQPWLSCERHVELESLQRNPDLHCNTCFSKHIPEGRAPSSFFAPFFFFPLPEPLWLHYKLVLNYIWRQSCSLSVCDCKS